MPLETASIWAELRLALDELNKPLADANGGLIAAIDAADLGSESEKGALDALPFGEFSSAYFSAAMRANTRFAHEAIEKGLKAILLGNGLSPKRVRSRGHGLDSLLEDVERHDPTAFNELERCFGGAIQYLKNVTNIQHNPNILEYFREHGKTEVFVVSRYASIEQRKPAWGMIGFVYMEIIHTLSLLVCGLTPRDINRRIEIAATKAVLAESNRDPAWDADEWIGQELVRPRLEVVENLKNNWVLRAALRRCAKEYKHRDWGIWSWADHVRRNYIGTRRTRLKGDEAAVKTHI
ncbi:MAG: HEPN domain-containing protein [Gammaproteobacteria bacterium]|nr:HEPN domain-containing protein [Gammaproteobacteria bacterium]